MIQLQFIAVGNISSSVWFLCSFLHFHVDDVINLDSSKPNTVINVVAPKPNFNNVAASGLAEQCIFIDPTKKKKNRNIIECVWKVEANIINYYIVKPSCNRLDFI